MAVTKGRAGLPTSERLPVDVVSRIATHLNQRRNKEARRRNRPKLSPEGHQVLCIKLNNSGSLAPKDADATIINIQGIVKKFISYCKYNNIPDWRTAIRECDKGTTMSFLRYICEHFRGESEGSVHQYLRQFKMLYNRVNGRWMDTNDAREALKYLMNVLTAEFGLVKSVKSKPVLGPDDVLLLLTHHWARDTCTFPTEDQRVSLAAIILLSIYTGCRPAELVDGLKRKAASQYSWEKVEDSECEWQDYKGKLDDPDYDVPDPWENPNDPDYEALRDEDVNLGDLMRSYKAICYEDVRLWIVQNPKQGERDLLAMEITLAHHKGADNKPKPTTYLFREEVLPILCPISHILALAIKDDAFQVKGLTIAEPFFDTNLKNPMKAVKLHWKPKWLKRPIFRQAIRTPEGLRTSERKALRYSTYAYYVNRLGWEAGFEEKLTCYCMRRGTANAVDGATTTAVRDQIMRHDPNSGVFNAAYLNEKVRFDVQAAFLERPSVDGLTRAFTHMSLTADPRAPKDVPDEVVKALPLDPDIIDLESEREELKLSLQRRYMAVTRAEGKTSDWDAYQTLVKQINNAKKKRCEEIKKQYRRDYHFYIHNQEMERQLQKIRTDEYVEPVVEHQLPERTRLQEVICDFSEDLPMHGIVSRRVRAINLILALCSRREDQRPKQRPSQVSQALIKEESPDVEPIPLVCAKNQCPICIGDERLTFKEWTFSYSRARDMTRHVERAHLKGRPSNQRIDCHHPVCKSSRLVLNNIMHFKNHVATVHGITLRA